jgi:hypothetical protein
MTCVQCQRRLRKSAQSDDPDFCLRCYRRIDEISLARGARLLLSTSPEIQRTLTYKERETFYFMQIFHLERGERSNREFARTLKGES